VTSAKPPPAISAVIPKTNAPAPKAPVPAHPVKEEKKQQTLFSAKPTSIVEDVPMKSDNEPSITTPGPSTNENVSTNKPQKPTAEELDVPMTTTKQEEKKLAKKRLTRGASSDHDEPMKQPTSSGDEDHGVKRGTTGKKKRQMIEESDEDEGQPDVENKNVPNVPISNKQVPKGKKKVKKTRTYFDEKGYMVNEDYSSYEECDEEPKLLPPISQMVKKEPIKRVMQHNLTKDSGHGSKQTAAPGGKTQSSLSAFFKK
jgi:DNA polymerase subunit Cdc27